MVTPGKFMIAFKIRKYPEITGEVCCLQDFGSRISVGFQLSPPRFHLCCGPLGHVCLFTHDAVDVNKIATAFLAKPPP